MSDPSPKLPVKPEIIEVPNQNKPTQRLLATSYQGPLPPPDLLAGYERACPGSADRIVKMAEEEAQHRRSIESAIVRAQENESKGEFAEARRGQICALLVVLVTVGAAVYLAAIGQATAASIMGVGGVSTIVVAFLADKSRNKENGIGQSKQPSPPKRQKGR